MRIRIMLYAVIATMMLSLPSMTVAQEERPKLISIDRMTLHVLTEGPTDFQQDGWTVTFEQLNASPKSDDLQSADYEVTATQGKTTIHYFVHEVHGYNAKAASLEHTISVRAPLAELDQFLKLGMASRSKKN